MMFSHDDGDINAVMVCKWIGVQESMTTRYTI